MKIKRESEGKEKESAFTLLIPLGDACFSRRSFRGLIRTHEEAAHFLTFMHSTIGRTKKCFLFTLSTILNQSAAECVCVSHIAIFKIHFLHRIILNFILQQIGIFFLFTLYTHSKKYTFKFIIFFKVAGSQNKISV
jgi:hypothetical protein